MEWNLFILPRVTSKQLILRNSSGGLQEFPNGIKLIKVSLRKYVYEIYSRVIVGSLKFTKL